MSGGIQDDDGPSPDYVPFWNRPREAEPRPVEAQPLKTAATGSSIAMALLPAFALIADIVIYAQGQISWAEIIVCALAFDAIAYALARVDQRQLASVGFEAPTSPWLAFVVPSLYLFLRGARAWREISSGYRPAWLSVLVVLIVGFGLLALPTLVTALQSLEAARSAYGQ